jgi:hypothetical protein
MVFLKESSLPIRRAQVCWISAWILQTAFHTWVILLTFDQVRKIRQTVAQSNLVSLPAEPGDYLIYLNDTAAKTALARLKNKQSGRTFPIAVAS